MTAALVTIVFPSNSLPTGKPTGFPSYITIIPEDQNAMSEQENPVIYYDPKTKKKYTWEELRWLRGRGKISEDSLHTRIMSRKDKRKIIHEVPAYMELSPEMYDFMQQEYEILGGEGSERIYEVLEAWPNLLAMKPIEVIDWSPISMDLYHTKDYYIEKKDRKKLLAEAKKAYVVKYGKKATQKRITPKVYVYYRKRLKSGKRHPAIFKRQVKFRKFTTPTLTIAIADVLDNIKEAMAYYYVVAERPSTTEEGQQEYRTIVGKTSVE